MHAPIRSEEPPSVAQGAKEGIIAQTLCSVWPHNGQLSASALLVSNLAGRACVQSISIYFPFLHYTDNPVSDPTSCFLFIPHYNSAFLKSYSAILKKKKKKNPLTLSTFLPFESTSVFFFFLC